MASMEEADSGTSLTFRPSTAPNSADARGARTVTFPSQVGAQQRTVLLDAGRWEVDWAGYVGPKHLNVGSGAVPAVVLRTISGRCEAREGRCELVRDDVVRRLTITDPHD